MKKITAHSQKGQTLIEVVVAIVVASFFLVSLTTLIIDIYQNLNNNQNDGQALQFSQEGMEYLRSQQSELFSVSGTNYCLNTLSLSSIVQPISCTSATTSTLKDALGIQYLRTFSIGIEGSGKCTQTVDTYQIYPVEVDTGWHDSKCAAANYFCHISRIATCLSNAMTLPIQGL